MNKRGILLVIIILGILAMNIAVYAKEERLDRKVDGERYIIKLKNNTSSERTSVKASLKAFGDRVRRESDKYISATLTREEAANLENNPNVAYVVREPSLKAFLHNSTIIVNSTRARNLQVSGVNLTGSSEAVCVIDSGVNSSHPALSGKVIAEQCYCSSKEGGVAGCCLDLSSIDDNGGDNYGHGTHVAGIVSASSGATGISGAKIVSIKILNSTGDADNIDDLILAIDWCTDNSSVYNISAISLSLGTSTTYSDYCDNQAGLGSLSDSINAAVLKNISVVVATGNDASTTGIAAPACMDNSTAVAATDKADSVTSYSDRNSLVKLVAPGGTANTQVSGINSTWLDGSYVGRYGTSMATPHVAGAIAIIKHFLKLSSQLKTPKQIEDILNSTGKRVLDAGSGLYFSRINIYSALLSIDNIAPNATRSFPANNQINLSVNQTFSCNATDWQLANVTFYLWNSSHYLVNQSNVSVSGVSNSSNFIIYNLSDSSYRWACSASDIKGNLAALSSNFTLVRQGVVVLLNSPADGNNTNISSNNFSCTSTSEAGYSLTNVTFYLWNSSQGLINQSSRNISGFENSTIFNYSFSVEGNYSWNCESRNNNSNLSRYSDNFTVTYDVSAPEAIGKTESVSTNSATIGWNSTENARFTIIYGSSLALGSSTSSSEFSINQSSSLSALSEGTTYYYNITSCDRAGNCRVNGTYSFTTSTTPASPSGGGSGGSSGATTKTYSPDAEEIEEGYTQQIGSGDKIKFKIENYTHELTLKNTSGNYAYISIKSNETLLLLTVGQERKINLSGSQYYDLYLKLEAINNNKINLTIKKIWEEIKQIGLVAFDNSDEDSASGESFGAGDEEIKQAKQEDNSEKIYKLIKRSVILGLICMIIVALFEGIRLHMRKKNKGWNKGNIKHGKKA